MRAVIQRVKSASVKVNNETVGSINKGYLIYLGVNKTDNREIALKMAHKIINLRVFPDENEKLNLNILDHQGSILLVSQFTLYGDTKKGNRPSFFEAALPDFANELYLEVYNELKKHLHIEKGVFQEYMDVHSINDGPVTIIMEID